MFNQGDAEADGNVRYPLRELKDMFDKKTVFIIGAGASAHFGYPTNAELLDLVRAEATELTIFNSRRGATLPMPKVVERLKSPLRFNLGESAWADFHHECETLIKRINLNRPIVIDHFLRDNPELQILGKTLIAKVISRKEFECFKNMDGVKFDENWVSHIANKMADNCIEPNDIIKNDVHFITFNYDLSLERLLIGNLTSRTRFGGIDFKSFLQERFIHVYGAIAEDASSPPLDQFRDMDPRQQSLFCEDLDFAYSASTLMRLIDLNEKDQNEKEIERAKSLLSEAADIYVLGYSFDASNNARLGFPEIIRSKPCPGGERRVYFTSYGADKVAVSRRASWAIFGREDLFSDVLTFRHVYDYGTIYAERSEKTVFNALGHDFVL